MIEIRAAIDELAAEQSQRLATAERVESLTEELQRLLASYGVPVENAGAPAGP
jgi:hypothetical protein